MKEYRYVQYGGKWSAPKGWKNFDASPTLRFERFPFIGRIYTKNELRFPSNIEYGDIVKGLPVPRESCYGIYCSHILEHLSLFDLRIALKNTHKILKTGGLFRLVLPDLEYLVEKYLNDPASDAAINFMKETFLGLERRNRSLFRFFIEWYGNSRHLWLWDYKSMKSELESVGFVGIRRAFFGDSSDLMFQKVEDKDRWENCLGVECMK